MTPEERAAFLANRQAKKHAALEEEAKPEVDPRFIHGSELASYPYKPEGLKCRAPGCEDYGTMSHSTHGGEHFYCREHFH